MAPCCCGCVGSYFRPNESELVGYYLLYKVLGRSIPNERQLVPTLNIYGDTALDPWTIWSNFGGQSSGDDGDIYFFTTLKKTKTTSGKKSSRASRKAGSHACWHEVNAILVHDCLGMKRRLNYWTTKPNQDGHVGWILFEYSLKDYPPHVDNREEFVLCQLRKNDKKPGNRKLLDVDDDDEGGGGRKLNIRKRKLLNHDDNDTTLVQHHTKMQRTVDLESLRNIPAEVIRLDDQPHDDYFATAPNLTSDYFVAPADPTMASSLLARPEVDLDNPHQQAAPSTSLITCDDQIQYYSDTSSIRTTDVLFSNTTTQSFAVPEQHLGSSQPIEESAAPTYIDESYTTHGQFGIADHLNDDYAFLSFLELDKEVVSNKFNFDDDGAVGDALQQLVWGMESTRSATT